MKLYRIYKDEDETIVPEELLIKAELGKEKGVAIAVVEDLRAWLKEFNKETGVYWDRVANNKQRVAPPHMSEKYGKGGRKEALDYTLGYMAGYQKARKKFRELLAELSKTGGPEVTREKPPPRSFL